MKQSARRREYEMWRAEYKKAEALCDGADPKSLLFSRMRSRMAYTQAKMDQIKQVPGVAIPNRQGTDDENA